MSLSRIGRMSRASRQDVTWKRGRMSLHAFLHIKTSPPCLPKRCLVVARRPVAGLQRDDVNRRAGDGTRTRDSLLGRQELYWTFDGDISVKQTSADLPSTKPTDIEFLLRSVRMPSVGHGWQVV